MKGQIKAAGDCKESISPEDFHLLSYFSLGKAMSPQQGILMRTILVTGRCPQLWFLYLCCGGIALPCFLEKKSTKAYLQDLCFLYILFNLYFLQPHLATTSAFFSLQPQLSSAFSSLSIFKPQLF